MLGRWELHALLEALRHFSRSLFAELRQHSYQRVLREFNSLGRLNGPPQRLPFWTTWKCDGVRQQSWYFWELWLLSGVVLAVSDDASWRKLPVAISYTLVTVVIHFILLSIGIGEALLSGWSGLLLVIPKTFVRVSFSGSTILLSLFQSRFQPPIVGV